MFEPDRRHGLRHLVGECDYAITQLAKHRDIHLLGRLGWVFRPCHAADRRLHRLQPTSSRLRPPRAGFNISPYAPLADPLYSHDAYATLIENLFLSGARLDPDALGTPDNRPDIRDAITSAKFLDGHVEPIGNLLDEFDFTQPPLPRLVLSAHIPSGITASCSPNTPGRRSKPRPDPVHPQGRTPIRGPFWALTQF